MPSSPTCLALEPGAKLSAVRDALRAAGLSHAHDLVGDGQRVSNEEVWTTPDRRSAVNIVDDPLIEFAYLAIRGLRRDELLARLSALPRTLTAAAALARTQQPLNDAALIHAIYQLQVLHPEANDAAFEVMRSTVMSHPNAKVREAAIDAIGYRMWPVCAPLLATAARDDPNPAVRQRAHEVLAHMRPAAGG